MAGASINIGANLTLNPQSLNAATKEIRQALGRITGNASEFQKSLDASTARVFAFGATTAVIQGVNQSFRALLATTVDVEKRLIEIRSIFGGTTQEFNQFREDIFKVARDTGQSFSTVADAAAEFARQGLGAVETAKRLEAALILTRVSGLDSVKAVSALTAAINGFKSAGLTAEQITNKLIAVDTKFAVSSKDLADGLSRAGSTAEDANVSFDELLGIITAVQQKTARGGAVIGNALKTIFTRIGRQGVIEDLQALGVAIDASQSGVQKLKAIGQAFEAATGDPTRQNAIKELAAGGFQINIISAALKDLNSELSIYEDATQASAKATNEAFTKNAELSKSLASQFNSLIVNVTNLGEKIGQLSFVPLLASLTEKASSIGDFLNKALDPEQGNTLIKALFKSIGSFISGPGLVFISAAFAKIVQLVARYASEGFKSVLSIGTETEKLKSIQVGIVNSLINDKKFREQILSTTLSQAEKQKAVADAIARENTLLREQQQLLTSISRQALLRGVTGFDKDKGFVGKGSKPLAAKGFTPSFQASTQETMMETAAAKEHGYKAGKVFNTRLYDGKGGSFKATVNNAETIKTVKGPNGKLGTYVIPPNGFAGRGFIPNYASKLDNGASQILKISKMNGSTLAAFMKGKNFQEAPDTEPAKVAAFARQKQLGLEIQAREAARVQLKGATYGMLVPTIGFNQDLTQFQGTASSTPYIIDKLAIRGPNPSRADSAADPQDEQLKANIYKRIIEEGVRFGNTLDGSRLNKGTLAAQLGANQGYKGAINAAVGTAFEAAVLASYPVDRFSNERTAILNKVGGNFDLRGAGPKIKEIFGLPELATNLDFKASADKYSLENFVSKMLKEQAASPKEKAKATEFADRKGFAGGFVPNFKNRGELLGMGEFGGFFKLKNDIGVKRLGQGKDKSVSIGRSDIVDEYVWSKFLANFNQVPAVKAPQVFGSLERSIAAKRIGKQIVSDPLAATSKVGNRLSRVIPQLFQERGIGLDDFHTDNFTVNEAAENALLNSPSFKGQYDPTTAQAKVALQSAESKGGKIHILDAGAGYMTALSSDVQKELDQIFKESKRQKSTSPTKASGFIPNFVSPNALKSLKLRANYKGADPRLIAEAQNAKRILAKQGLSQKPAGQLSKNQFLQEFDSSLDQEAKDFISRTPVEQLNQYLKNGYLAGALDIDNSKLKQRNFSFAGNGFVPNFGLLGMVQAAKFAGSAAKTFGASLPAGTFSSAIKGQFNVDSVIDNLFDFIKKPTQLIKSVSDLENAKATVRTFLTNDTLREAFAKKVAPILSSVSYANESARQTDGPYDADKYLRYRLLGGSKSIEESGFADTSRGQIAQKGKFFKIIDKNRQEDIATAAYKAEKHGYDPVHQFTKHRLIDNKGGYYGEQYMLGGFTGRIRSYKGKKYASYKDTWDVALNAQEKKVLHDALTEQNLEGHLFDQLRGTNSYGNSQVSSLILRDIVSAIPKAKPVTFRGVVPMEANGFVPNFASKFLFKPALGWNEGGQELTSFLPSEKQLLQIYQSLSGSRMLADLIAEKTGRKNIFAVRGGELGADGSYFNGGRDLNKDNLEIKRRLLNKENFLRFSSVANHELGHRVSAQFGERNKKGARIVSKQTIGNNPNFVGMVEDLQQSPARGLNDPFKESINRISQGNYRDSSYAEEVFADFVSGMFSPSLGNNNLRYASHPVGQYIIKKLGISKDMLSKVGYKASGFIPNFSAVQDAIKREQKAGVPKSAIYVDSSPQLKSSRNPSGLMVANTIDEPRGGRQGIQRAKKEGRNPKTYGAAKGFVPNYAPKIGGVNIRSGSTPSIMDFRISERVNKELANLADQLRMGTSSLSSVRKQFESLTKSLAITKKSQEDLNKKGQGLISAYTVELQNRKAIADSLRKGRARTADPTKPLASFGGIVSDDTGSKKIDKSILSTSGRRNVENTVVPSKFSQGLEKANDKLSKFGGTLGTAQFGLFALSSASNVLFENNEKLNSTIQMATVGLSTISSAASVVPLLFTPFGALAVAAGALGYALWDVENRISEANKAGNETNFRSNQLSIRRDKQEDSVLNIANQINKDILAGGIKNSLQSLIDTSDKGRGGSDVLDQVIQKLREGSAGASGSERQIASSFALKELQKAQKEQGNIGKELDDLLLQRSRLSKNPEKNADALNALNKQIKDKEKEFKAAANSFNIAFTRAGETITKSFYGFREKLNQSLNSLDIGFSTFSKKISEINNQLQIDATTFDVAGKTNIREGAPLSNMVQQRIQNEQNKAGFYQAQSNFRGSFTEIKEPLIQALKTGDATRNQEIIEALKKNLTTQFTTENISRGQKAELSDEQIKKIDFEVEKLGSNLAAASDIFGTTIANKAAPTLSSTSFQNEAFTAFIKNGVEGLKDKLKTVLPENVVANMGDDFYKKVTEAAEEFKQKTIDSYVAAKNNFNNINDQLTNLGPQIASAIKEAMANLPSELKGILEGPKTDPLALFKKFQEVADLRKKGKNKEASTLLASLSDQTTAYDKVAGKGASADLMGRAGLGEKDRGILKGAATNQQIDFSNISSMVEKALGKGSVGFGTVQKSIAAAQADPTKMGDLVRTIQEQLSGTRNQKTGQDIINSLKDFLTLENKGQTVQQVEDKINKSVPLVGKVDSSTQAAINEFKKANPYDNEAFKKLTEELKRGLGDDKKGIAAATQLRNAAIAEKERKQKEEENDPVKALKNQQTQLNAALEDARKQVEDFGNIIAPTGLKTSIDSIMESTRKAAENMESFVDFSAQLGSLNESIGKRLKQLENEVGGLKTAVGNARGG